MKALLPVVKKFDIHRFALTLVAALALSAPMSASAGPLSFFSGPPQCRALLDHEEFSRFGPVQAESPSLGARFRVLVWNVFKGDRPGLSHDFHNLSQGAHLVLIQEAVDQSKFLRKLTHAYEKLKWTMARSFLRGAGDYTGVATGSTVEPLNETRLLSPVTEPITHTPKSVLVSDFKIQGRDGRERVLRVINVHAINFVSNAAFEAHMNQVFEAIRAHQGPLILAGDFNTWNFGRTQFLKSAEERFGLKLAHSSPGWLLTLDYVFTRGLKVVKAHDLAKIESSDHQPLLIDFELDED